VPAKRKKCIETTEKMKIFGIEYQGVTSRKCKMHVFDEKTKKVPSKIWISDDFVLSLYPNFGMEVFGVW